MQQQLKDRPSDAPNAAQHGDGVEAARLKRLVDQFRSDKHPRVPESDGAFAGDTSKRRR